MPNPYHIIVEQHPALIYGSRGGTPEKILPILTPFLEKFWLERESFGEYVDTPDCLVAQLTLRFGFETAEDDFSNIRITVNFHPDAEYLYWIGLDATVQVWVPQPTYQVTPTIGLAGCDRWQG